MPRPASPDSFVPSVPKSVARSTDYHGQRSNAEDASAHFRKACDRPTFVERCKLPIFSIVGTVADVERFAKIGLGLLAASVTGAAVGGAYWMNTTHADAARQAEQACAARVEACRGERDREHTDKEACRTASEAAANASQAELRELRAEHEEAEKRLEAFQSLTAKFRKMIDSGRLAVVVRHGRMVVKLPASVLFESGSAELSKDGVDALRDVAAILKQVRERRFMVAGHTDNVPVGVPTSPFMNNLDLSTSRALVVAQSLIKAGMNPAQLIAAGYGEYEPVADNRTEAGKRENRRIEIVLMPNLTEIPGVLGDTKDAGAAPATKDAGAAPSTKDAGTPPSSSTKDAGTSKDAGRK